MFVVGRRVSRNGDNKNREEARWKLGETQVYGENVPGTARLNRVRITERRPTKAVVDEASDEGRRLK